MNLQESDYEYLEAKRQIILSLADEPDYDVFRRACKNYTNTYERLARKYRGEKGAPFGRELPEPTPKKRKRKN